MCAELKSPTYTTRWTDLPMVKKNLILEGKYLFQRILKVIHGLA
ncbi:DUF4113 domain-containing protein [Legionella nautarum]|nr:DUF4113 domain-containing protein [Legionella nautarum]